MAKGTCAVDRMEAGPAWEPVVPWVAIPTDQAQQGLATPLPAANGLCLDGS